MAVQKFDRSVLKVGQVFIMGLNILAFALGFVLQVKGAGISQGQLYVINRPGFDSAPYNQAVCPKCGRTVRLHVLKLDENLFPADHVSHGDAPGLLRPHRH